MGQNGPKSGPKLFFLPFSQILLVNFPLICMWWLAYGTSKFNGSPSKS